LHIILCFIHKLFLKFPLFFRYISEFLIWFLKSMFILHALFIFHIDIFTYVKQKPIWNGEMFRPFEISLYVGFTAEQKTVEIWSTIGNHIWSLNNIFRGISWPSERPYAWQKSGYCFLISKHHVALVPSLSSPFMMQLMIALLIIFN
jgi:hypothetical protein